MKKRASILIVLCLSLILALGVCACGSKKENEKEITSQSGTTASAETTASTETTIPEYEDTGSDELTEITSNLVNKLNKLNALDSLMVDKDESVAYVYPENGLTYFYVKDADFQSFGHISKFLDECTTWDFSENYFPRLAYPSGESTPPYIFVQEEGYPKGLYVLNGGKGYSTYDPNADITFDDVQDDYFVAYIPYDFYGEIRTLTLEIVNDGNGWKLCGMDRGID